MRDRDLLDLLDLLAERRANVQEARRETDPTAKAMLLAHVDTIDAEQARRREVHDG